MLFPLKPRKQLSAHQPSNRVRTKASRKRSSRKILCERLEDRRLLAADVLLADSFESGQWNGTWVEDSQNDWFDSSNRAFAGSHSAEVDGRATDAALTLADPIDLTTYDSAELTYAWRIKKNWDAGEYMAMDVFSGGSWQEAAKLSGNLDAENTWHEVTVDLGSHLTEDFKIRFRASVSGSREDGNIDDVKIVGTSAGSEFSIGDVTAAEGDSGATEFAFTVTRSGDTSAAASVSYATADDTATTGDNDYVAAAGQLNFAAGEIEKTITVDVTGDTAIEGAETFTVNLSTPSSGGSIVDGVGDATILNDDSANTNEFELSSLLGANGGDGSTGAVIAGLETATSSLNSLSIIDDVNGDGRDDILIAGSYENYAERGKVFVVFGQDGGIGSDFDLATLDGTNGFRINGPWDASNEVQNGWFGRSVASAGDVNGDGLGDIIVGAPRALEPAGSGAAYIVLGSLTPTATFDVDALDGTNGFKITGPDKDHGSAEIGELVASAGDINGDGYSDILVDSLKRDGGSAIVLFGASSFGTSSASAVIDLNDIDGTNGFVIESFGTVAVQTLLAGDFNGDGVDDLAIGANEGAGRVSVLMGRASTTSNPNPFIDGVDLLTLDGSDGFNVGGLVEGDRLGYSARSAGDINADGIDDIVMGALYAEPGGKYRAGESYIIFGQAAGFPADFDLATLDGTNGFYVSGGKEGDRSSSVSGVGDFNGDEIDDVAILAGKADPANGSVDAGQLYIVYGRDNGFSAGIDLATFDGSQGAIFNGFRQEGLMTRLGPGSGDVNGDGRPDLTLIARNADPNGIQDAGEVYVVYGRAAIDPPVDPEASLSIGNSSVTEAASGTVGMEFVVTLSEVLTEDVTVDYGTMDLTATAGADYVATSGTLTIPAGDTSAVLTVQVNADSPLEGVERFVLTLSNPDGATIQYADGTGTIVDYVAPTKFYVADNVAPAIYKYEADGTYLGNYHGSFIGNFHTRGIATTPDGTEIFSLLSNGQVIRDRADGNIVTSWTADGTVQPDGIATDGDDIWIVDRGTDKVYFYEHGAEIASPTRVTSTSSFALANGNKNPRGITTDGTNLWVVNSKSAKDEVFKYTMSGTLVGRWTIDTANVNPRGITIDPANVDHLWIVDSTTDSVYQYSGAASRTSGSQSADSVFALAAGNTNPQGIADPPPVRLGAHTAAASSAPVAANSAPPTSAQRFVITRNTESEIDHVFNQHAVRKIASFGVLNVDSSLDEVIDNLVEQQDEADGADAADLTTALDRSFREWAATEN